MPLHACSLEAGARDISALTEAAPRLSPGTLVSIPHLSGQGDDQRLAALQAVRDLGLEPMPHIAARHVGSAAALADFVARAVGDAGVERCLLIAGDPTLPAGPFVDSAAVIETGILEKAGLRCVGVAAHPERHPQMDTAQCQAVLEHKCAQISRRGMAPLIFTQFTFDADPVLAWLDALRERGIVHPVRVGVPGPARIAALVRYAALCGVGASASMLSRYGVSIGRLLGTAGPDVFVDRLVAGMSPAHGQVGLHVHPFGGIARSVEWIAGYRQRTDG